MTCGEDALRSFGTAVCPPVAQGDVQLQAHRRDVVRELAACVGHPTLVGLQAEPVDHVPRATLHHFSRQPESLRRRNELPDAVCAYQDRHLGALRKQWPEIHGSHVRLGGDARVLVRHQVPEGPGHVQPRLHPGLGEHPIVHITIEEDAPWRASALDALALFRQVGLVVYGQLVGLCNARLAAGGGWPPALEQGSSCVADMGDRELACHQVHVHQRTRRPRVSGIQGWNAARNLVLALQEAVVQRRLRIGLPPLMLQEQLDDALAHKLRHVVASRTMPVVHASQHELILHRQDGKAVLIRGISLVPLLASPAEPEAVPQPVQQTCAVRVHARGEDELLPLLGEPGLSVVVLVVGHRAKGHCSPRPERVGSEELGEPLVGQEFGARRGLGQRQGFQQHRPRLGIARVGPGEAGQACSPAEHLVHLVLGGPREVGPDAAGPRRTRRLRGRHAAPIVSNVGATVLDFAGAVLLRIAAMAQMLCRGHALAHGVVA
mmetsp:Transcript_68946/g.199640  ORF Transcript_68946/g.199640 Transcript_68946/m.199640 type:complete len:491 (-) Transcript_68946:33-1505(-)